MSSQVRDLGNDPDAPNATATHEDEVQHFVFRVGQALMAVAPGDVDRVVPVLKPVRVPTAPAQVLGVAHLQGRIVTVVALHRVLGLEARTDLAGNDARTLILRAAAGVFAAEVHQVLGLRSVATAGLRAPQRADASDLFSAEYDTKEGAVTVIDIERLFDALARS